MDRTSDSSGTASLWRRLAALALVAAALGLPINDLFRALLLLIATVVIVVGVVTPRLEAWAIAVGVVVAVLLGQFLLPAPRIDEGHNVFIVDGPGGALERGLPAEAFRLMAAEFDARSPPDRRCQHGSPGCWRDHGFPDQPFAFSADGIYQRPAYSRRIVGIEFSDPVWLRLGAINELRYNWNAASDLQRNTRTRGIEAIWHPWRLDMPFFVMYRFPAEFVGARLCFQGHVLWEGADGSFAAWRQAEMACRPIEAADVGRRIFGLSIAAPLEMSLETPFEMQIRRLVEPGLTLIAVCAVLMLLVRWRQRQTTLPFVLVGLALVVVFFNDSSFIGGVRPFDGGDDGLFYDGVARTILRHLLNGEYAAALEGGEKVFYYGGPGLRYFLAIQHLIFGETYLGYLGAVLTLPFVVRMIFARFFSARTALALTLIFIAVPIGAVFGTSFFQYDKWAARGFADPAAAIAFLSGFIVLIGRTVNGPGTRFAPAFGAGLLFALALFIRPNLAPGAAVLLGGAGLAALWQRQGLRLAGLCLGFLPVFGMALHNWVFGHALVLFSANATITEALPMPPSAWVAAFGELIRLDLGGEHVRHGVLQIARWLAGPSESFVMIPLHALSIAVLVRVVLARRYEPWLRLTAGAALALHPVALFYLSADRYYYLTWFLTLLACAVWMRDEGVEHLRRFFPETMARIESNPAQAFWARVLDRWARA